MKEKYPSTKVLNTGYLLGYRLDFTRYSSNWGGGVADIVLDSNSEVWGLLYELSSKDIARLDEQEGHPTAYVRLPIEINTSEGLIPNVYVYQVVEKKEFIPPIKGYLRIIENAAGRFGFPESYKSFLAKIVTKEELHS